MGRVYVEPYGTNQWRAVWTDDAGKYELIGIYGSQQEAENAAWNYSGGGQGTAIGGGAAPGAGAIPGVGQYPGYGGFGTVQTYPYYQESIAVQQAIAQMNDAFQRLQMNMLDIPAMQMLDERERARIALDAVISASQQVGQAMQFEAEQTGWLPEDFTGTFRQMIDQYTQPFVEQLRAGTYPGAPGGGVGGGGYTPTDVAEARRQLVQASGGMDYWRTAPDSAVISEFVKLAGSNPQHADLINRLRQGPAGGGAAIGPSGADIANARQQLVQASGGMDYWRTAPDNEVISEFVKLASSNPQHADLIARLTGAAAEPTYGIPQPGGIQPGVAYTPADIANVRNQMVAAGGDYWRTAPINEVVSEWMNIVVPEPAGTPQGDLQRRVGGVATIPEPITGTIGMERLETGPYVAPTTRAVTGPEGIYQQGGTTGQIPTIPRTALMAAPKSLASNLGLMGVDPLMAQTTVEQMPYAQGGAQPSMTMEAIQRDPAKVAQSLIAGGYTPEQAAQILTGTPMVQGLLGQAPTSSAQAGSPFPFISGHQLPVRQTLQQMATASQKIPLLQGLMQFSGRDPLEEFSKFMHYLPKGSTAAPTRFI